MSGTGLGTTISLPDPPAGWFDYDYVVLMDGSLAILRTDRDYQREYRRWAEAAGRRDVSARKPSMAGRRLSLSVFDGRAERFLFERDSPRFPMMDRLADGHWLLVEARAEPRAPNGLLLSPDGAAMQRFVAGDGIQDIACAPDGSFWIGYFDEGIFGGDEGPDGQWPIGAAGLARLSGRGEVLWRFNMAAPAGPSIADCYALTLNRNTAWICPYMDFPLIRIEGGRKKVWSNEVAGALALAVSGEHVLLAGGYGDDGDRLALVWLREDRTLKLGETRLPLADAPSLRRTKGMNGVLHIVEDGLWTRISVAEAVAHFPP